VINSSTDVDVNDMSCALRQLHVAIILCHHIRAEDVSFSPKVLIFEDLFYDLEPQHVSILMKCLKNLSSRHFLIVCAAQISTIKFFSNDTAFEDSKTSIPFVNQFDKVVLLAHGYSIFTSNPTTLVEELKSYENLLAQRHSDFEAFDYNTKEIGIGCAVSRALRSMTKSDIDFIFKRLGNLKTVLTADEGMSAVKLEPVTTNIFQNLLFCKIDFQPMLTFYRTYAAIEREILIKIYDQKQNLFIFILTVKLGKFC
jgi:hypothetical protein